MTDSLLRQARLAKGYSQSEVAREVGLKHRSSVSNLELGYTRPSAKIAWRLFRLLGVDPVALREGGRNDR